jgi:hypothetical protein
MEQRQHIRSSINGLTVYISDQAGLCNGVIKDISRFGICIGDIPRKLQTKNGSFNAVINGKGNTFKLQLKEKWKDENGQTTIIGAGIDDAPWDWAEMTLRHELQSRNNCVENFSC